LSLIINNKTKVKILSIGLRPHGPR